MGLKGLLGKAGKAAWNNKSLLLKGVELHPAAKMVLSVKNLQSQDKLKVAAELVAVHIVSRMTDDALSDREALLEAIEPILTEIVSKADIPPQLAGWVLHEVAGKVENQ